MWFKTQQLFYKENRKYNDTVQLASSIKCAKWTIYFSYKRSHEHSIWAKESLTTECSMSWSYCIISLLLTHACNISYNFIGCWIVDLQWNETPLAFNEYIIYYMADKKKTISEQIISLIEVSLNRSGQWFTLGF